MDYWCRKRNSGNRLEYLDFLPARARPPHKPLLLVDRGHPPAAASIVGGVLAVVTATRATITAAMVACLRRMLKHNPQGQAHELLLLQNHKP